MLVGSATNVQNLSHAPLPVKIWDTGSLLVVLRCFHCASDKIWQCGYPFRIYLQVNDTEPIEYINSLCMGLQLGISNMEKLGNEADLIPALVSLWLLINLE